jgi:hypothetical protein
MPVTTANDPHTLADRDLAGQIARKGMPAPIQATKCWPVERTHAWGNNFGTDRRRPRDLHQLHGRRREPEPYLDLNIATFAGDPGSVDPDDEEFQESNLMHSINGYVYGNMPMITMRRGERVRWYTMDMGTEVDLHSPHWHGNTLLVNGMRMDVVQLLPGGMVTGTMIPDDPGTWLFHCHVNDHILAGMLTRYQVA